MKNTITILTLLSSLFTVCALAAPVEDNPECPSSEVFTGVIESISEPEHDPEAEAEVLSYDISINTLPDMKESAENSILYYQLNMSTQKDVAIYRLLLLSKRDGIPVSGAITSSDNYYFLDPAKEGLLPGMVIHPKHCRYGAVNPDECRIPEYSQPNNTSGATWHWGQVLKVALYNKQCSILMGFKRKSLRYGSNQGDTLQEQI